jgi:hypothetical protein
MHSIGPQTVLGHFGPCHYCTKADAKLTELVPLTHKFAERSYGGKFHNERTCSTKLDVLGHFGTFHYCTKLDAKLAELAPLTPKFAKQSCVGIFRNKCTRSTPLDTKLMF